MKNVLIILALVFLSSCGEKEASNKVVILKPTMSVNDTVNLVVNTLYVKNLKNPKSYEFVSNKIDTCTYRTFVANSLRFARYDVGYNRGNLVMSHKLDKIYKMIGGENLREHKRELAKFRNELKNSETQKKVLLTDSIRFAPKGTKGDSIVAINIKHEYRARNGFNALDLYTMEFNYYPATKNIVRTGID